MCVFVCVAVQRLKEQAKKDVAAKIAPYQQIIESYGHR
jgi:hypothetical protein